ncbi:putative Ig domain-containing protein [Salipiger sp. 1_MG-2023]|uniref:putative Ig domain-containing protein n=1 Tax=Salipiger sp. 1_MG-2023 TaxID=3062665 RepID=UPI0026E2CB3F|nr:putative Ig domain-containing protein [Salipiger sp. 1_MG-2023]MDO6587314.1 putative Ig domain-containing protein [Salipiger sp. 1_MG-2023]
MAERSTIQPYSWQAVTRGAEPASDGWSNVNADASGGLPITETLTAGVDFTLGQDVLATVPGATNYSRVRTDVAPALSAVSDQSADAGSAVSLDLSSLATGTNLVWSASNLPGGLSIDAATGVISGTLGDDIGTYPASVTVSNSRGGVTQAFDWAVVPDYATGILVGGDSLMDGASGISLWQTMDTASGLSVQNIAEGGNNITQVSEQFTTLANTDLLDYPVVIWDGSQNGIDDLTGDKVVAYVDLIADAVATIPHNKWLVIPPINTYGSTYSGGQAQAIWLEMASREAFDGHILHWADGLVNTDYSIDISQFNDAPTDIYHLSQEGADNMSDLILGEMRSRNWIGSTPFSPTDLDGLVFHGAFTADVSTLTNLVPGGDDMVQATASRQAVYDDSDGIPKWIFDGSNDYYTGGPVAGAERTIAVAIRKIGVLGFIYGSVAASNTRSNISVDGSGTRINVGANTPAIRLGVTNSRWQSFVASHDGTTVQAMVANTIANAGTAISTAAQSGVTTPNVESYLGNFNNNGAVYTSNYYDGEIAALLEWDRVLTDDEMRSVRSWMQRIYGYDLD